jgi:hypothetical protein
LSLSSTQALAWLFLTDAVRPLEGARLPPLVTAGYRHVCIRLTGPFCRRNDACRLWKNPLTRGRACASAWSSVVTLPLLSVSSCPCGRCGPWFAFLFRLCRAVRGCLPLLSVSSRTMRFAPAGLFQLRLYRGGGNPPSRGRMASVTIEPKVRGQAKACVSEGDDHLAHLKGVPAGMYRSNSLTV